MKAKKLVSIVLILCLVAGLAVPAAAAEKKCDCGHDPVIYVHGFGTNLYETVDGESQRIYPPRTELYKEQAITMAGAVIALALRQYRLFADLGMRAAEALLGAVACDPTGEVRPGTGITSTALPKTDEHGKMKNGIADYTFSYDWRLSPLDNAELLRAYVDQVKKICGHSKVSFVCHSMGGTVLASYLYLYGSDDVSHMVALAPAWQGLSIMGSLLSGEADISDKADELDMFLRSVPSISDKRLQFLIRVAGMSGAYPYILRFLQGALDDQFERVFDEFLLGTFGTMPGIWAFVSDSYYERAKTYSFGDDPQYDTLREKVDLYHYEVQNKLADLLSEAMDGGMQLVILSGYGISSMPLSRAHTVQSDVLIDTTLTSIGATCAPYGSTLSSGTILSPDKTVDAGTCAFPQQTWFISGMMHFDFPREAVDFVQWAVEQKEQPTFETSDNYPQFVVRDADVGVAAPAK